MKEQKNIVADTDTHPQVITWFIHLGVRERWPALLHVPVVNAAEVAAVADVCCSLVYWWQYRAYLFHNIAQTRKKGKLTKWMMNNKILLKILLWIFAFSSTSILSYWCTHHTYVHSQQYYAGHSRFLFSLLDRPYPHLEPGHISDSPGRAHTKQTHTPNQKKKKNWNSPMPLCAENEIKNKSLLQQISNIHNYIIRRNTNKSIERWQYPNIYIHNKHTCT